MHNLSYEEKLMTEFTNVSIPKTARLKIETHQIMNTYDQEVTPNLKFAENTVRGLSKKLMVQHAHKNIPYINLATVVEKQKHGILYSQ